MNTAQNNQKQYTQANKVKVKSLLLQFKQSAEEMLLTLDLERKHLLDINASELIKVVESKTALLNNINELEQLRKRLSGEAIANNNEKYIEWLKPFGNELNSQWLEIKEILKQCNKKNTANGIIGDKMADNTSELMSILTGVKKQENTRLYSEDGRTSSDTHVLHNTTA